MLIKNDDGEYVYEAIEYVKTYDFSTNRYVLSRLVEEADFSDGENIEVSFRINECQYKPVYTFQDYKESTKAKH